jgi:predicted cupin superfamily sugar epimerase
MTSIATGFIDVLDRARIHPARSLEHYPACVNAAILIERLGLAPHPEGGWYRETWRADAPPGGRSAGSAILFLLAAGERSHWHRVTDATELWIFNGGDPLELRVVAAPRSEVVTILGGNPAVDERPQAIVPPGAWQTARPLGEWTLVSCIVVPAFEFSSFELAPEGWEPEG